MLNQGGRRFTWVSCDGLKMSKLDRFLIKNVFADDWEDAAAVVGDRVFFDHCPVLLKAKVVDFGPSPFRCYDHWLTLQGFKAMVKELWNIQLHGSPDFVLKQKLKGLKRGIVEWRNQNQQGLLASAEATKKKLLQLETEAEIRTLEPHEWACWKELKLKLSVAQKNIIKDLKQKARVKWALEGDENNKFFHAIIRGRKKKNDVKGLLINGIWIEEPGPIKEEIFQFFRNHYKETHLNRPTFINQHFKKLNNDESKALEAAFTDVEIKNAVWLCRGSKAPGLHGFNFNFIKVN